MTYDQIRSVLEREIKSSDLLRAFSPVCQAHPSMDNKAVELHVELMIGKGVVATAHLSKEDVGQRLALRRHISRYGLKNSILPEVTVVEDTAREMVKELCAALLEEGVTLSEEERLP